MNKTKKLFLIFWFGIMSWPVTWAKVMIFTYAYNRPDFIDIQYKTFKKFLKDEHELVVFNDARNVSMANKIKSTCDILKIKCVPIPQEIHNRPYLHRLPGENYNAPAVRNCNVVMYSLNEYGFKHDDILVLIDSDCFLVKDFSIRDYLKNYELAGIPQHMGYLWIGLVFMDFKRMPNKASIDFNCGSINGKAVDAGGYSYHYIKQNPQVKVRKFGPCYPQKFKKDLARLRSHKFRDVDIQFIQAGVHNIEYFLDNHFLHYRGGTNWDHKSSGYHSTKTSLLNKFIDGILAEEK